MEQHRRFLSLFPILTAFSRMVYPQTARQTCCENLHVRSRRCRAISSAAPFPTPSRCIQSLLSPCCTDVRGTVSRSVDAREMTIYPTAIPHPSHIPHLTSHISHPPHIPHLTVSPCITPSEVVSAVSPPYRRSTHVSCRQTRAPFKLLPAHHPEEELYTTSTQARTQRKCTGTRNYYLIHRAFTS